MNPEPLQLSKCTTDDCFDTIYPKRVRRLAKKHFTPLSVARSASEFLVKTPGSRVLDIGSGAGKFCMVGAITTKGCFTGIEQRAGLVALSKMLAASYQLTNVAFINANVIFIDFNEYDAFYIYNSFYENIDKRQNIDDTVILNPPLYDTYSSHTSAKLSACSPGVRLATYYTSPSIVPPSFALVDSLYDDQLKFWEKR